MKRVDQIVKELNQKWGFSKLQTKDIRRELIGLALDACHDSSVRNELMDELPLED